MRRDCKELVSRENVNYSHYDGGHYLRYLT